MKIKFSSTNDVNGNFLLSEGSPTKFSPFSIFEIFVQPSNFLRPSKAVDASKIGPSERITTGLVI